MAEIQIPVQPIPIERLPDRSLTSMERSLWKRLLRKSSEATDAIQRAGVLLQNIYITYSFARSRGVYLFPMDDSDERLFYDIQNQHRQLIRAIRGVHDRTLGIRIIGHDLDIMDPQQNMDGLVIPVIIGTIVIAGAIAAAIYQTRRAIELSKKYVEIIQRTDKTLCSEPGSKLCEEWKRAKKERGYNKNETLADSLKTGMKKISGGLSTGLLIAIPIVALLALGRKK